MNVVAWDNLSDSARDFRELVWPILEGRLGGTIEPVEGVSSDDHARRLDMLAGIDAWNYLSDDGGIRGIASRVQWCPVPWRTFTIRRSVPSGRPTEYHKRLRAIENPDLGLIYPHYTVQAYLARRGGPVTAVAYIPTSQLILYVRDVGARWRSAPGGQTFFYVPWDALRAYGTDIVYSLPR